MVPGLWKEDVRPGEQREEGLQPVMPMPDPAHDPIQADTMIGVRAEEL
jgi:hypothetical protein